TRFSRDWSSDVCSSDLEVDEQVVDQHHQQYAINDAEHIDAPRLLFQVGIGRPQRQGRLNRPLAFQAQVDTLQPVGLQLQLEQVRSEERRVGKWRRAR